MSAHKHTPFLSNEQVQALNEKHGWFKHGDAQSDVSRAFANDAVAAYERVRSAAPELLEALITKVKDAEQRSFEDWLEFNSPSGDHEAVQRQWLASNDYRGFIGEWREQLDAIAKATGEPA